jgi:hypothetical protein
MSHTPRFIRYLERHREAAGDSQHDPASDAPEPGPRAPSSLFGPYEYTQGQDETTSDLEKALRAMGFLLEWSSDAGNKSPNSFLVYGIAIGLSDCADEIHGGIQEER